MGQNMDRNFKVTAKAEIGQHYCTHPGRYKLDKVLYCTQPGRSTQLDKVLCLALNTEPFHKYPIL